MSKASKARLFALLTIRDVLDILRRQVEAAGSQQAFAERAGVSQAYVGDILRGQRTPGAKILHALGLEKVVAYREKD